MGRLEMGPRDAPEGAITHRGAPEHRNHITQSESPDRLGRGFLARDTGCYLPWMSLKRLSAAWAMSLITPSFS